MHSGDEDDELCSVDRFDRTELFTKKTVIPKIRNSVFTERKFPSGKISLSITERKSYLKHGNENFRLDIFFF